ncbi:MAG: ATP synthase F1 subunit gamma [Marinilabiliaceae bacterium]|jgi:F-type H+-transporting ATPase subunit gamma|nr:ATP synthase F1 subunit gamma [Marinilabiliaceae bacterium]
MANLKEIRTRLNSVKSTRQITAAMKMVAAAKLRKAQDKILRLRPYAGKLHEILLGISARIEDTDSAGSFSRVSEPENILLIVVTSNRGLCGAFNSNVIKETVRIIKGKYSKQALAKTLHIMAIGKKGADYFRKSPYGLADNRSTIFDDLSFDNVNLIASEVMDSFLAGKYDRVEFVYNQFKNAAVQILTNETFLPVETKDEEETSVVSDYIYEPGRKEIIEELIPKTLKIEFYRIILDSYVAEHGARMTAMHMATDNASELIRDLTLEYNKARQASITSEILEVVSGAEALKA